MDAEPPIASFLNAMLIGGGPVDAVVRPYPKSSSSPPSDSADSMTTGIRSADLADATWVATDRNLALCRLWVGFARNDGDQRSFI